MRTALMAAILLCSCESREEEVEAAVHRVAHAQLRSMVAREQWWCSRGVHDGQPHSFCTRERAGCEANADKLPTFSVCAAFPEAWCFEGKPGEPSCHPTAASCSLASERFVRVMGTVALGCEAR